MDLTYDTNVYKEMMNIFNKYKHMVKILNRNYNEGILMNLGIPPEILGCIFSYLSLGGLVNCGLTCSSFLKEVKPLMQGNNIYITTLEEWKHIFSGFNNNISVLIYDATKCYLKESLKLKHTELPNLKKIILHITFPDQLDILKTICYKPLEIEIVTCSTGCDGICLGKIIKHNIKQFGKKVKLRHQGKMKICG